MKLENDLRSALSKREFSVHYQPLVDLGSGKIRGVEALLRWTHPELGTISPAVFIPLAEQTGVIVELGEWVLEEACKQVKSWQLAGNPDLTLAVNISIRQFKSPDLAESVSRVLRSVDFDPALLELEVTESRSSAKASSKQRKSPSFSSTVARSDKAIIITVLSLRTRSGFYWDEKIAFGATNRQGHYP